MRRAIKTWRKNYGALGTSIECDKQKIAFSEVSVHSSAAGERAGVFLTQRSQRPQRVKFLSNRRDADWRERLSFSEISVLSSKAGVR